MSSRDATFLRSQTLTRSLPSSLFSLLLFIWICNPSGGSLCFPKHCSLYKLPYSAWCFIKIKFIVLYYKFSTHFIENLEHTDRVKEVKKSHPDLTTQRSLLLTLSFALLRIYPYIQFYKTGIISYMLSFLFYFTWYYIERFFSPISQNVFENVIFNDYTVVHNILLWSPTVENTGDFQWFININNYTQFLCMFLIISLW